MPSSLPHLVDVLIAPDAAAGGTGPLSLGLLADDGAVTWGDVPLPAGVDHATAIASALRLRERITPALSGQRPEGLRDLSGRVRQAIGGEGAIGETLLPAAQWAWLEAIRVIPEAAPQLRREYALPVNDPAAPLCCFLEISDHAATAERIDQLLALRPAGVGYRLTGGRVAEAIGDNAEHLQRFVRELGRRAETLAPGEGYRPSMYLGLNGALGQLAGDPVRHIGKVLGNVVGLQVAAGERQLILEEPFRLDDLLGQAANLHRLREFIRRTPDSLKRAAPTLLAARAPATPNDAQVYSDTVAAHVLVYDAPGCDLDAALSSLGRTAAGLASYWRLTAEATPRQAVLAVWLAQVTRSAAVVVNCDADAHTLPPFVLRLLAEHSAGWV